MPSTIVITIDDVDHTATDEDQEAASLLRLADRDPKRYDLFLVDDRGVEDVVRDDQIINLVDGMRFRARRKVRLRIDGERFETYDDDQTAAALIRLAGLPPAGYDLAKLLKGGGTRTYSDEETVDIEDGDQFVTAKQVGGVA